MPCFSNLYCTRMAISGNVIEKQMMKWEVSLSISKQRRPLSLDLLSASLFPLHPSILLSPAFCHNFTWGSMQICAVYQFYILSLPLIHAHKSHSQKMQQPHPMPPIFINLFDEVFEHHTLQCVDSHIMRGFVCCSQCNSTEPNSRLVDKPAQVSALR